MKPGDKGFVRIFKATNYSYKGFLRAWRNEAAFRQESVLCAVLIPIAMLANVEPLEEIVMIASLFLVLIVELLNSAVEAVVDRVGSEYHLLSGAAKDMGSAAVFLSLALVVFVWTGILL